VDRWLAEYGHRVYDLDPAQEILQDDRPLVLHLISRFIDIEGVSPLERQKSITKDRISEKNKLSNGPADGQSGESFYGLLWLLLNATRVLGNPGLFICILDGLFSAGQHSASEHDFAQETYLVCPLTCSSFVHHNSKHLSTALVRILKKLRERYTKHEHYTFSSRC